MATLSWEERDVSGRDDGARSASSTVDQAIYTEGLIRRFDEELAVDHVNLAIPAGEIYGFLGPQWRR